MAQRSFKLSNELEARLIKEAGRQGRSVSNLIVRLLDAYVSGYEQATPPPRSWESPGVTAQRLADEASKKGLDKQSVEGTPLPKIAPRRQPR